MTKGTTQTLNLEDLSRRQIRYICFRLQTEAEGGGRANSQKTGVMAYVDKVKKHMETQDGFGSWKTFAKTWDVDNKSPLVVVKRISSVQTEWNKILKEEAKELPVKEESDGGGKKLLTNKLRQKVQEKKSQSEKSDFWTKLKEK
jgi:hypothetical protein